MPLFGRGGRPAKAVDRSNRALYSRRARPQQFGLAIRLYPYARYGRAAEPQCADLPVDPWSLVHGRRWGAGWTLVRYLPPSALWRIAIGWTGPWVKVAHFGLFFVKQGVDTKSRLLQYLVQNCW